MNRFESTTHPAIYWAIAISVVAVFAIDLQTRIGIATWILYLIPLMLCFKVSKPWLPGVIAGICTVFIVIDWFISAPGIAEQIAQLNRGLGIFVMLSTALLAHNSLTLRLKLRHDEWIRTARTRIADVVVGEQSLNRLAERVLEFLTGYLGAQAGAMYVAEASGHYVRAGGVGLPAESSSLTVFKPGEGLLGRAVTEHRAIRIDNLPSDYLRIGSGLGNSKPQALLVAPLNIENSAHGVIELGFLQPTFDSDIELLNTIGEPIAIALRTSMLRRERETLLRETQRQAEELQTQQEEKVCASPSPRRVSKTCRRASGSSARRADTHESHRARSHRRIGGSHRGAAADPRRAAGKFHGGRGGRHSPAMTARKARRRHLHRVRHEIGAWAIEAGFQQGTEQRAAGNRDRHQNGRAVLPGQQQEPQCREGDEREHGGPAETGEVARDQLDPARPDCFLQIRGIAQRQQDGRVKRVGLAVLQFVGKLRKGPQRSTDRADAGKHPEFQLPGARPEVGNPA
jgi:hypothetical protein